MTRHIHDSGQVVEASIDYDHVVHHPSGDPGLLVVTDVPARVCTVCDEHWFDEPVGFELARLLEKNEPEPGSVRTIAWAEVHAA